MWPRNGFASHQGRNEIAKFQVQKIPKFALNEIRLIQFITKTQTLNFTTILLKYKTTPILKTKQNLTNKKVETIQHMKNI